MVLNDETITKLENELNESSGLIVDKKTLESFRQIWLSRDGYIKSIFKECKSIAAEERATVAARINLLKSRAEAILKDGETRLFAQQVEQQLKGQFVDLSLSGANPGVGCYHPITLFERRVAALLRPFGFVCQEGPELETEYYCFDSLNIPKYHPARDMQDTFYTSNGQLLRTHTTSVQARVLKAGEKLPIKIMTFGRAYRNETEDASHQAIFHQFELIWLQEGLTLANLLGLITYLLKGVFGQERQVRFVPKFYPYTEPSIGPQVDCALCHAKGCSACTNSGWVTVAGAGMIHNKVLQEFGYDTPGISGMAFGLGTSRLAAQLYSLPTLASVYDNDLRILSGGQSL